MAEKTEKATPKKLRDARKKGQVAKSQDFPSAFTFAVSLAATLWSIGWIFRKVAAFTIELFGNLETLSRVQNLPSLFHEAGKLILVVSLPILGVTALMGVIVNFLVVGPTWAPEVFKPSIKKFHPINNLKQKFKLKTLFELVKSIFKISGASVLIFYVVKRALPVLVNCCKLHILDALAVLAHFIFEVIYQVGLFFVVVAVADLIFQKRQFAKEMMMEKFELKQEFKNTDGNPEIKSKRRQIGQEIAYQDGPEAGVKKAKLIVTNPVHLAIAVGYESDLDPAPFIAAMGKGHVAALIVKEADNLGVPVLRNIPLAHKLWEEGELWEYVPEHTYEALAAIFQWLYAQDPDGSPTDLSDYDPVPMV